MTRARHQLHLMLPQRFYVTQQAGGGDRHVYANRTRFIPGTVEDRFKRVAWPAAGTNAAADADVPIVGDATPTLDLAARMRGMWKAPS
jgi:DNA helicase-2/ATP-dependent DNA helicase PcrA